MISKTQKILVALLILQLALIGWAFWPEQDGLEAGIPLIANGSLINVNRVEIQTDLGETLSLELDSSSARWVHAPSGYPLTDGIVAELIEKLENVETGRLVTQTPASHSRLRVAEDQFQAKVSVWSDGVKHELIVGSAPNSRSVHVRVPNQDEVWLTDAFSSDDVDPSVRNWLNTLYYSVDRSDVVALTVENENGIFQFEQTTPAGEDSEENFVAPIWTLAQLTDGQQLNLEQFNNLLSQATSMRFLEPLGDVAHPSFGLDKPMSKITIQLKNDERTLRIGAYDEQTDSYVIDSDFGPIVRISSPAVNRFVEANLEALIFEATNE